MHYTNALKADTSLQERLNPAANLDDVVAIAKEACFVVTKAEVLQAQAQAVELNDEELEAERTVTGVQL